VHRLPTFDPLDVSPAEAARLVRMQWRMPVGPVRNLTAWLEGAGCLVIEEDFGTARVDGLSQWVSDHPLVLLNSQTVTDRKRLTLAHELGHLVLHSADVTPHIELEATEFGAEFLMPAEVVGPQLRNLSLGVLMDLKREWGVSLQALIERAFALDLVSPQKRTTLYKSLSSRGWRTREPVSDELAREQPGLTTEIAQAMTDRGLTPEQIAALAGWADPTRNTLFVGAARPLRAVR
jgi:Zn-dependent peptidase ImmA (M78 family)